ncbi:MAG: 30S ribosomal protein S7 [Candidatus Helarchaeota archaeon]
MEELAYFGKWSPANVEVRDEGLRKYINLEARLVPHTHGRHEHKRFRKSNVSILERFINRLLAPGLSRRKTGGRQTNVLSGQKLKTMNIVRKSFEIIYLQTGENPIQILVRAVENCAPREETTRISYGGIVYQQSVDVSPQRRVDLALKYLVEGCFRSSFNNLSSIEEIIANELILASREDAKSKAIKRKEEKERMALSVR